MADMEHDAAATDNTADEEKKLAERYKNTTKVLVLSSRGVGHRIRHLLQDLTDMLPHAKRDTKLDEKSRLQAVNEVCDLKNCNSSIFIEARKKTDFYMWFAATPDGPSFKCHLLNVHTTAELRMTGNCLKGSRPLLYFDPIFDSVCAPPAAAPSKALRSLLLPAAGSPS